MTPSVSSAPWRAIALAALVTLAATATAARAQTMVSIDGSTVNMREGPSTRSTVLWELRRGYPLQVTQRRGNWLAVKDFEGDTGWVARSLTARVPHHVVKSKVANVRSGPGTGYRIVGRAEYGELMRTREKRDGWVRVERDQGASGWIAKRLLWGF